MIFTALAFATALSATSATVGNGPVDAYRISVRGGFYTGIHEAIAFTRVHDDASSKDLWVVERRSRTTLGPDGPVRTLVHDWIDGRSCPELRATILQIGPLARAKPRRTPQPFHGVSVNVKTVRRDGGVTRVQDYEGPVAPWWRDQPVELNGVALPAMLDSDEAEKRFTAIDD
jgi:hypothetical protein